MTETAADTLKVVVLPEKIICETVKIKRHLKRKSGSELVFDECNGSIHEINKENDAGSIWRTTEGQKPVSRSCNIQDESSPVLKKCQSAEQPLFKSNGLLLEECGSFLNVVRPMAKKVETVKAPRQGRRRRKRPEDETADNKKDEIDQKVPTTDVENNDVLLGNKEVVNNQDPLERFIMKVTNDFEKDYFGQMTMLGNVNGQEDEWYLESMTSLAGAFETLPEDDDDVMAAASLCLKNSSDGVKDAATPLPLKNSGDDDMGASMLSLNNNSGEIDDVEAAEIEALLKVQGSNTGKSGFNTEEEAAVGHGTYHY